MSMNAFRTRSAGTLDRRRFLGTMGLGAAAFSAGLMPSRGARAMGSSSGPSTVSFVAGDDRVDMIGRSLEPFRRQLADELRGRRVMVKINMPSKLDMLSLTHPDAVRGLLEFLAPIHDGEIVIAECSLAKEGLGRLSAEYGYDKLAGDYGARIVELHDRPTTPMWILGKNLRPERIEIIDDFLDRENYIISITPPKTHDVVVATLGLKNIVMSCPMKNFEGENSKYKMHGAGPWWLNYNLFAVAQHVLPNFTVIDGLEGMEGDGPIRGRRVEHNFALAGKDVIAVDSIGAGLMGFDPKDIGYLAFCGEAGVGRSDTENIRVVGGDWRRHIKQYRPHKYYDYQMYWKNDVRIEGWDPDQLPF